jgi:hypothetical protein
MTVEHQRTVAAHRRLGGRISSALRRQLSLGVTHFTEKTRGSVQNNLVADAHGRITATGNSSPQEKVMSIRIATGTTPSKRSIAQHKAPVVIAGLLAAVLTANIAEAGTSSRHRQASMPERNWTADYTSAYLSRYAPASQVTPGRGIFEEHNSAP